MLNSLKPAAVAEGRIKFELGLKLLKNSLLLSSSDLCSVALTMG